MLNVKLQIEHGDTKFEIIGEVQITTVGYLQLRGGGRVAGLQKVRVFDILEVSESSFMNRLDI